MDWQPVVSCIQTFNRFSRVWQTAVSCIQLVVKPIVQPGLTTDWTNSGCSFNTVERTVAVRSARLSNRLTTSLTTGWMFVYTIQPVVNPVVQLVWQPVVSCKRGINFSRGMPYIVMWSAANLTTLASRREEMPRKFFLHISQPTSCLHQLLPDPRDHSVISRLRTYEIYPPSSSVHSH